MRSQKQSMPINCFHIGDYKTGTTWLQKYGFSQHPDIQYLGDPIKDIAPNLNKLMHQITDARDVDFDSRSLRQQFVEQLGLSSEGKIRLLSREALSSTNYITGENTLRTAKRLKEVFGDIKVIVFFREQESMLRSIYSQYVKMGGTLNSQDFFLDPYECRGLLERLMYHKTLGALVDVFGRDNVFVDIFDRLKHDQSTLLREIYGFVGCEDVNFQPQFDDSIPNKSLTQLGALFARSCNRFVRSYHHNRSANIVRLEKIIFWFLSAEKKRLYADYTQQTIVPSYGSLDKDKRVLFAINEMVLSKIRRASEKISIGREITLPAELQKELTDYFKESNQVLEATYGLPVRQYGWPC